jgi:hypothetical protein
LTKINQIIKFIAKMAPGKAKRRKRGESQPVAKKLISEERLF